MKISVTTYSFTKYLKSTKCDYLSLCDKVKEMGFDAIEFTSLTNYPDSLLGTPEQTAVKIREHCEKIGLPICSYTVGADLAFEKGEEGLTKLKAEIDIAHLLGVPVLRHDICYALPKEHLVSYRDAIVSLVPRIREATEYAASYGIKTCSENHGYIFQAPERVEELILAVGNKNYGWLCDIGNFMCVDRDPIGAVTVAAPYAFHAHAKDFLFKSGTSGECPSGFFKTAGENYLRGTILGHGTVPVKQCVNILKKAGYDGYISVEFEGLEECVDAVSRGLEYLRGCI